MTGWRNRAVIFSAVFLTGLGVFYPSLQHGFINWDDFAYIHEVAQVKQLSWPNIKWFFFNSHNANWHPLTGISYAVDYFFWGENPAGFRLTNIFLHALNGALLFLLLSDLLERYGENETRHGISNFLVPAVVAVIFLVHPLRVESVVWIAERKDVLFAFFYLLAIWCYVKLQPVTGRARVLGLAGVAALHALSLMSKPMAVTLPVILILLDIFPFRRVALKASFIAWKRVLIEKLPFIALSLVAAYLTLWAQQGAIEAASEVEVLERISAALYAYGFYLGKLVFPVDLVPFYPHPAFSGGEISVFALLSAIVSIVALVVIATLNWRKRPVIAVSLAMYAAMLVPVIGLVQVGPQIAADRYTYLAMIPPTFLIVAFVSAIGERLTHGALRMLPAGLLLGLGVVLGAATLQQARLWENSLSLWNHTLSLYPNVDALPYYQRGLAYDNDLGDKARALADFDKAISLNPNHYDALISKGIVLAELARLDEAKQAFDQAIRLDKTNTRAYSNRGTLQHIMGDKDAALEDYLHSIRLDPDNAEAHFNASIIYREMGNRELARQHLDRAKKLGL